MSSEELERQLVKLSKLATVAGERLEELSRNVDALRSIIDEVEAGLVALNESSAGGEKKAANRTLDPEVAQVEVVTK